jgi:hypothetical protein
MSRIAQEFADGRKVVMRVLLFVAAIVLLLALVGWVSFTYGPGRSSINLETQEIREDTKELLQSGSEALQDAERSMESRERAEEDADQTAATSTL